MRFLTTIPTTDVLLYIAIAVLAVVLVVLTAVYVADTRKKKGALQAKETPPASAEVVQVAEEVEAPALVEEAPALSEETSNEQTVPVAEETPQTLVAEEPVQPVAEDAEEAEEDSPVSVAIGGRTFTVQYRKSFLAKLLQSTDATKTYYAALQNELAAYGAAKERISWDYASYNAGRTQIAKLSVRGKTLCLYLALPYEEFADSKYRVAESTAKKYAKVPTLLRVRSDRALKYAKELIALAMERAGVARGETDLSVTAADYPYESTEALIERELIKYAVKADDGADVPELATADVTSLIRAQVTVTQAHELISDATADELMEVEAGGPHTNYGSGKKYAVNIDTLARYFSAGDTVDLAALKAKGLVPKKEKAVKILARGTLDRPLVVHANAFSRDAVKMIVLTGGKAILIK